MPLAHLLAHHDTGIAPASSSHHAHHHGDDHYASFYHVQEERPPTRLPTDTADEWFLKEADSMIKNADRWAVKKMLLATKTERARRRMYHLLYGETAPPMVVPQHPLTKEGWTDNMYLSVPFDHLPKLKKINKCSQNYVK